MALSVSPTRRIYGLIFQFRFGRCRKTRTTQLRSRRSSSQSCYWPVPDPERSCSTPSSAPAPSVVAKKLGRRFIGVEKEEPYCLLTEARLELAERDCSIQGYAGGYFWERNTLASQRGASRCHPSPRSDNLRYSKDNREKPPVPYERLCRRSRPVCANSSIAAPTSFRGTRLKALGRRETPLKMLSPAHSKKLFGEHCGEYWSNFLVAPWPISRSRTATDYTT